MMCFFSQGTRGEEKHSMPGGFLQCHPQTEGKGAEPWHLHAYQNHRVPWISEENGKIAHDLEKVKSDTDGVLANLNRQPEGLHLSKDAFGKFPTKHGIPVLEGLNVAECKVTESLLRYERVRLDAQLVDRRELNADYLAGKSCGRIVVHPHYRSSIK